MIIRLARLLPLFVVLLIVSCFSAQAEEPLPDRPDVSSAPSTEIDLDVGALPPKGPPKLESALWQLVQAHRPGGQPAATDGASFSVAPATDGRVQVIVEAAPSRAEDAAAVARSLGATVEASYGHLVQVSVPIGALQALASSDVVKFVRQPTRYFPAVTGEGVGLVNADDWHAAGVTGSGVKVAVLDGGFSGYSSLLGSELPSSVTTQSFRVDGRIDLGFDDNPTVHGTAVAEIVHEMAPDAQLYLVNFQTDPELANAVSWIVGQGVKVINASWGCSICGPGDGTGFDNDVVANSIASGTQWAIAAGNEAHIHWMGNWADTNANDWLDWSTSPIDEIDSVYLSDGDPIYALLKWDDSYGASCNDYQICLFYIPTGQPPELVYCSQNEQNCDDDPVEEIPPGTVSPGGQWGLGIFRYSAVGAAKFHLYTTINPTNCFPSTGCMQYGEPAGSLSIPADNPDAVSVGAVPWWSPSTIEPFSSQGPTEDGRTKPDLVAPDRVSGASYGPTAFGGTSAASPHVAGAAALVKQAHPSYSPAQIKSFLEGRAVDLGAGGKDNVYGSGRLDLRSPPPPDSDGDGVADESDNCAYVVNPLQENHDDDGAGDACDCDDDNGGTPDNQEARDGTNPLNPGDDQPLDTADSDGDGALNWEEDWCGTDPFDPCGDDCDPYPPYGTDDAWAYDINMDCWANATDILMFPANVNMPAQLGVHPSYRCRYDLDGNNWVNATDILMFPARVPASGMPLECTNP